MHLDNCYCDCCGSCGTAGCCNYYCACCIMFDEMLSEDEVITQVSCKQEDASGE